MPPFTKLTEKIRRDDAISLPLAALLSAATPLIRLGMWRRSGYVAQRVGAYVVSFGNVTAGGTGKTPAVIERARAEIERGRKVGILTRGYGSKRFTVVDDYTPVPELVPKWKPSVIRYPKKKPVLSIYLKPEEYLPYLGDEAALILAQVPEVVVVKTPDRLAGAYAAIKEAECNVLILDDGYQYTRLEKDEDVLVIDASNPFGNGALLPRGILRESLDALARATSIILTRCDQARDLDALLKTIEGYSPGVPIRKTVHLPVALRRANGGDDVPLTWLKDMIVTAACGIGNPEAFYATLETLGALIKERVVVPDHQPLPPSVLPESGTVVITEKDHIRSTNWGGNVFVLSVELRDI